MDQLNVRVVERALIRDIGRVIRENIEHVIFQEKFRRIYYIFPAVTSLNFKIWEFGSCEYDGSF